MALVDGGDLVVRAIKHEGVDTIFTLCGGHVQAIYDSCLDEGVKVIDEPQLGRLVLRTITSFLVFVGLLASGLDSVLASVCRSQNTSPTVRHCTEPTLARPILWVLPR